VKISVLFWQLIIKYILMLQESHACGEISLSHISFSKFAENLNKLLVKRFWQ